MVPRKQAGHMTCTRPQAARQIPLATRASSTHDPLVTSAVHQTPAVVAFSWTDADFAKKDSDHSHVSIGARDP
jgi:hypothetical protein